MKISILNLRQLIREEIGRNFQTMNNDPFSFEDYEEIAVEIYPVERGNSYQVKIETVDGTISRPLRSFATEHEAKHYARNESEYLRRVLASREI
jgi:hypothetical protein